MTPEEFFAILRDMPLPIDHPHRLYHDDAGRVLFYSMEDLPGTWIAVDSETYARARHDVRVVDGTIVELPRVAEVAKLRPSSEGVCCDPRDICMIVSADQPHVKWRLSTCE